MKSKGLYSKYLNKFKRCIDKKVPLTQKEIKILTKINKNAFSQHYLSQLRKFGLVVIFPGVSYNRKIFRKFFKKDFNIKTSENYYFFTIETSKIRIMLDEIINKFSSVLKNHEEVIRKSNQLITLLSEYETVVSAIPKYAGVEAIEEVNKRIEEGESNKNLLKFINENTDRINTPISSEIALADLRKALFEANTGEVINPEEFKEDFKELNEKVTNFLITGNSDTPFSGKFPIAGYPVLLIRSFNIRYALYGFISSIKKNINYN